MTHLVVGFMLRLASLYLTQNSKHTIPPQKQVNASATVVHILPTPSLSIKTVLSGGPAISETPMRKIWRVAHCMEASTSGHPAPIETLQIKELIITIGKPIPMDQIKLPIIGIPTCDLDKKGRRGEGPIIK
mmetsp:Transcript_36368/g.57888  ORF Transcript_36368/g.57888 Transcript_36368/m.57888 type:complete len:131 (-) Transcript_36368:1461-1853(-)